MTCSCTQRKEKKAVTSPDPTSGAGTAPWTRHDGLGHPLRSGSRREMVGTLAVPSFFSTTPVEIVELDCVGGGKMAQLFACANFLNAIGQEDSSATEIVLSASGAGMADITTRAPFLGIAVEWEAKREMMRKSSLVIQFTCHTADTIWSTIYTNYLSYEAQTITRFLTLDLPSACSSGEIYVPVIQKLPWMPYGHFKLGRAMAAEMGVPPGEGGGPLLYGTDLVTIYLDGMTNPGAQVTDRPFTARVRLITAHSPVLERMMRLAGGLH